MIEKRLEEFARKNGLRIKEKKIKPEKEYGYCRALCIYNGFEASYHYDKQRQCWY